MGGCRRFTHTKAASIFLWYSRKISKPCLNGSHSSMYTLPRLRGVARILHKGVLTLVMFAVGSMIVASTLLTKKLKGVLEPQSPPSLCHCRLARGQTHSLKPRGRSDKLSQLHNNHMTSWYLITFLFRIRVPYSCACAMPAMVSNLSCVSFAERSSRPSFDLDDDDRFWALILEPSFRCIIRSFDVLAVR